MTRRGPVDDTRKPLDPAAESSDDGRDELKLKFRRPADPRKRRHVLAKIDALLAARRP